MTETKQKETRQEMRCPDCYGGHFRPCQTCCDTGFVFLTNPEMIAKMARAAARSKKERLLIMPWKPNEAEQQFVSTVGRMALDALAENGVADRATFTKNLNGLARLLERAI